MVRLVKGAYWDTEIKRAQVDGLPTIRCSRARCTPTCRTSRAPRRCSRRRTRCIRSSRATTRSRSQRSTRSPATRTTSSSACTAWAKHLRPGRRARASSIAPCRIYAPVGSHETLLAYLVRRLLENGANIVVRQPHRRSQRRDRRPRRRSGRPCAPHRRHAAPAYSATGGTVSGPQEFARTRFLRRERDARAHSAHGGAHRTRFGRTDARRSASAIRARVAAGRQPADRRDAVGTVEEADAADVAHAVAQAVDGGAAWSAQSVEARAACLLRAADLLEGEGPRSWGLRCAKQARRFPTR